jgi:POT family proton-dependent oligopeptide transporter
MRGLPAYQNRFTNIAGFSVLPATWLEKERGFWTSYLLAFASLWVTVLFLYSWRNHFSVSNLPPIRILLTVCSKVGASREHIAFGGWSNSLWGEKPISPSSRFTSLPNGTFWANCTMGRYYPTPSTSLFPCMQSNVYFPLHNPAAEYLISKPRIFSAPFYLAYIQISNNLISQAGQMRLGGIPNDAIQVANPIACIILGPVIQKLLFPFFSRRKIPFGPIIRISVACFTMGLAMAYASGVQRLIYSRGPCYNKPLLCAEFKGGTIGNDVSVWVQTPVYFILAVAEILGFATLSEIAYSKAPKSMKTMVQAVTQLTAGLASVIGIALSPAAKDPNLVIMYAVIAGLAAIVAFPFWWYFRRIDEDVDVEEAGESQ